MRRRPRAFTRQEPEQYRINGRIQALELRVIGKEGNLGVLSRGRALKMAEERGLDLVEISPSAHPPVCKLIDYSKFKYERKKKEKENKARAQRIVVKEIRFGPNTDEHDFEFKLRHAIAFLQEGAKIKAYVHFAGRTIVFKERGEHLLLRFAQALEPYGHVEEMPHLEGKRMFLMVSPLRTAAAKRAKPVASVKNTTNTKVEAYAESENKVQREEAL